MNIIMSSRFSLVLSTLAGVLLLMVIPVHAEKERGRISTADSHLEITQRKVRDKEDTALIKAVHTEGKKTQNQGQYP